MSVSETSSLIFNRYCQEIRVITRHFPVNNKFRNYQIIQKNQITNTYQIILNNRDHIIQVLFARRIGHMDYQYL
jgi:hypothetical protein